MSLKMAPFDRSYTNFYWSAIVNIAVSCTVFELFDVEKYGDLEIWVKGHSRSFKLVPFKSLGAVSYLLSIVTMALFCINSEIKRDWSKIAIFSTPPAFHAPLRGSQSAYRHKVWCAKTREVWLTEGEMSEVMTLVLTEYTNGRTDGQTHRQTDTA